MTSEELKRRTKAYALSVVQLVEDLPRSRATDVLGRQLLRCATSVGANYRAACRAKSPADFVAKMGIVEEETDESLYWMELLVEGGYVPEPDVKPLVDEGNQLLAIAIASIRTARSHKS